MWEIERQRPTCWENKTGEKTGDSKRCVRVEEEGSGWKKHSKAGEYQTLTAKCKKKEESIGLISCIACIAHY